MGNGPWLIFRGFLGLFRSRVLDDGPGRPTGDFRKIHCSPILKILSAGHRGLGFVLKMSGCHFDGFGRGLGDFQGFKF